MRELTLSVVDLCSIVHYQWFLQKKGQARKERACEVFYVKCNGMVRGLSDEVGHLCLEKFLPLHNKVCMSPLPLGGFCFCQESIFRAFYDVVDISEHLFLLLSLSRYYGAVFEVKHISEGCNLETLADRSIFTIKVE